MSAKRFFTVLTLAIVAISTASRPARAQLTMNDLNVRSTAERNRCDCSYDNLYGISEKERMRSEIQLILREMKGVDRQLRVLERRARALDDQSQYLISDVRRRAANGRMLGNSFAFLIGAGSAGMTRMSGGNDTSSDWRFALELMDSLDRDSRYAEAGAVQEAAALTNRRSREATLLSGRAGNLKRDMDKLRLRLERFIILHLRVVNRILRGIEGYDNSGLGRALDLAYAPGAVDDLSFEGPMIYSLTFKLNGAIVDVPIVDLKVFVENDFSDIIAARKKEVENAKHFSPKKMAKIFDAKINEIQSEMQKMYEEYVSVYKHTDAEKAEYNARHYKLNSEMQRLTRMRDAMLKDHWWNKEEKALRQKLAGQQLEHARVRLQRVLDAKAVLSKMKKEDVKKAIAEIEKII